MSEPTVKLITIAVNELKHDPKIGRAEALRQSMLTTIDTGKGDEAHPAFWAPAVLCQQPTFVPRLATAPKADIRAVVGHGPV